MKGAVEDVILEYPGEYDRQIPDVFLPEFVLEKIAVYGDEVACANVENGQRLTYADIGWTTRHLAAGFRCKWNLRTGGKVAVVLPSCLEYPLTVMAANLCGATAVLINPTQTTSEFRHVIKVANPDFWIATEAFLPTFRDLYGADAPLANVVLLGNENQTAVATWNRVMRLGGEQPPDLNLRSPDEDPKEQVALVLFSSGTTGVPKGVALTHYNLMACRRQSVEMLKNYPRMPDNRSVILLPQYHVLGLSSLLDNLIRGMFFVLVPKFSLHVLLRTVQDFKITIITLVPAIAVQLAKQPVEKRYDLSSIRLIAVGAAPIGKDVIDKLAEKFSCVVLQGYGMTESSLRTHGNSLTFNRTGSIGVTLPFCQSKVVDPETGRSLGPKEIGEICVRGPVVMKGYVGDEQSTRNTIDADGWLHTGDVGYYDSDGFFFITDRIKELIKYKGLQVAPSELEAILLNHPEVVDAAVVGVPDEDSGELPRAYVVKRSGSALTEQQVAEFVQGLVSQHKKLRGGVIFVKEIPRTKTGKIIRRQLKTLPSKL